MFCIDIDKIGPLCRSAGFCRPFCQFLPYAQCLRRSRSRKSPVSSENERKYQRFFREDPTLSISLQNTPEGERPMKVQWIGSLGCRPSPPCYAAARRSWQRWSSKPCSLLYFSGIPLFLLQSPPMCTYTCVRKWLAPQAPPRCVHPRVNWYYSTPCCYTHTRPRKLWIRLERIASVKSDWLAKTQSSASFAKPSQLRGFAVRPRSGRRGSVHARLVQTLTCTNANFLCLMLQPLAKSYFEAPSPNGCCSLVKVWCGGWKIPMAKMCWQRTLTLTRTLSRILCLALSLDRVLLTAM